MGTNETGGMRIPVTLWDRRPGDMGTRKTNGIGGTSIPVTPWDKGPEDTKDKRDKGNKYPHDLMG